LEREGVENVIALSPLDDAFRRPEEAKKDEEGLNAVHRTTSGVKNSRASRVPSRPEPGRVVGCDSKKAGEGYISQANVKRRKK